MSIIECPKHGATSPHDTGISECPSCAVELAAHLEARVAVLEAGMAAVLGDDHLVEYECEHGTPLGQPCFSDCHLNPTRRALGIVGTLPDDAE